MSDAMVANFSKMADNLSYDETISVISMLLEKLKKSFVKKTEPQPAFLEDLFAIADKNPELHRSNGKWSRDELYRY